MTLTTFDVGEHDTSAVLEAYRFRWQIEVLFKHLKQIAERGHLPKHDDENAKAWLYGKLFVALLAGELLAATESFSPWDIHSPPPRRRSRWREFALAWHQTLRAVEPVLSLARLLHRWSCIRRRFAPSSRRHRRLQEEYFSSS